MSTKTKKSSAKKIEAQIPQTNTTEPPAEVDPFESTCLELRKAKIVLKDATENEKRWKDQFLTLVRARNLDKGEYSGIGLSTSDSFDISNVEIAKKEKIAVPMIESANVKVGILRLKELIAKGILKADEVEFSTSPDLEKLEVLMQEKKIVCNYTRSYRTTVSKQ